MSKTKLVFTFQNLDLGLLMVNRQVVQANFAMENDHFLSKNGQAQFSHIDNCHTVAVGELGSNKISSQNKEHFIIDVKS